MKKLILTCAVLTSLTTLSFAQAQQNASQTTVTNSRSSQQTPEQAATQRTNQYVKQLGLNETQKKAVYEAELDLYKAEMVFKSTGDEIPSGPAYQMMLVHDQKFKNALTPDQYAKYDKNKTTATNAQPANH